ncbi:MAG TPA: glycosyltransferase family 39 protein [Planctomycetota bacterium]|nr:glycosyltransferase family 39 protein [Planctomycetota bacterium]HRR82533.1 glycosyltransferase family 39 protein [Planctomycetota bacterium]HRT96317.1 glycosyltransferase family 39 protein [Planctomycetota bacterium]
MYLDALRGLLLTVVANGALLYAAHLAARRWWPSTGAATRLAATGVLAIALTLAVFYPLALLGLFTRQAATIAALGIGLAAHWRRTSCGGFWADRRPVAGWLRAIVRSRGALLLAGAGLLVFWAAYRAAVWPPLSLDSLTYHNYFAGAWVQQGGFARLSLPQAMQGYARLPLHFEALVAWTMLPFHGDFLANFTNLPILALGAVAVYALGRELGLDLFASALAAGLVCFSPAVFAYACTQYNDVLVMGLTACAALFLVRWLAEGRWADAALAFLATGLAVGTKHTAIPPAAAIGLVAVLAPLRRAGGARRAAATLGLCLALNALGGGYAYVRNWVETGNPLYPATIRLLGKDIFPAAPVVEAVAESVGRGTWRDDVRQLASSISYAYGAEPAPLSWGPKLPLLALLALAAAALARRSPRGAELRWLTLCWAAPALLLYLDPSANTVAIRRFWPDTFSRFLAGPVALMAVGALVGVSLLAAERLRRVLHACLCVLMLFDLFALSILPDSPRVLVVAALGLAALGAGAMLGRRAAARVPAVAWGVAAGLAVLAGVCGTAWVRDRWRNHFLETRVELHPFPRHWVKGWAFCDEPQKPKTIALASYEPKLGHHWYFYPLMGRRLQNRVVYVPPEPGGPAAWKAGLDQAGVTHVFVQLNPALPPGDPAREPAEMAWIRARPDDFTLLDQGDHYRICQVAPPR